MTMSAEHVNELETAVLLLENPSFAIKATNWLGKPVEKIMTSLPKKISNGLGEVTIKALSKAADAALFTMKDLPRHKASTGWHKTATVITGGIAGFFGLAATAIELPISATIMIRSIADIAREYGESIDSNETKLACLEVLSLGGSSKNDDFAGSTYYGMRVYLNKTVTDAAEFLATKKLTDKAAPQLVKLIQKIAERYSISITEKQVLQSLPIVGAISGATVNTIFIDHYQDMAKGHFAVRRLERIYGKKIVETEYNNLRMRR